MLNDVFRKKTSESFLKPHTYVAYLEESCQNGYDNTRTNEKEQSENTPYDAVDLAVHVFYRLQNFVHFKMNLLNYYSSAE